MLDLNISNDSPKTNGIFTEQTQTPTSFNKACEEYGTFVNPFDEIFRHAVEEKSDKVLATGQSSVQQQIHDDESLHTPQVFPPLETSTVTASTTTTITQSSDINIGITNVPSSIATIPTLSTPIINDLLMQQTVNPIEQTEKVTPNSSDIKKYRPIAEKPLASNQFLQITPTPLLTVDLTESTLKSNLTTGTAIPIQTVKPLILPKVETKLKLSTNQISTQTNQIVTSPSSASLTPTSQLPIKERLKVILNNNSKSQGALVTTTQSNTTSHAASPHQNHGKHCLANSKYDERCMERRRAAATRYRNKIRNEHKDLRKRNLELQTENEKLRLRIAELEQLAMKSVVPLVTTTATAQIQIPPSSIHLIMNIPKLIVPANGPPLLNNSITYSVEKK